MTKKKKPLIVLAQSLEQPRIVKRIIQKSAEEESIHVYGFKRKLHAVKNYGALEGLGNVSLKVVGNLDNGRYFSRIFMYIKLLSLLYKKYGLKEKRVYVFGLDLRITCFFLWNASVYYEISDIMWLYKEGTIKKVLSNIDKYLAKISNKVIFTSSGFYKKHYKGIVAPKHVVIEENKFAPYSKVKPIENLRKDRLSIAYIGAFRYTEIVKSLLNVVSDRNDIDLNFYGDGTNGVVSLMKEMALNHANIQFHGPFKNPDDLENIYKQNNLNFVVYDNRGENEQIAMPNKFYESGYFNIPIVCATNTYVGERVLENNMGWVCNIKEEDISLFLDSITIDQIFEHHINIKALDKSQFSC